jgi:hypothetical protein
MAQVVESEVLSSNSSIAKNSTSLLINENYWRQISLIPYFGGHFLTLHFSGLDQGMASPYQNEVGNVLILFFIIYFSKKFVILDIINSAILIWIS